MKIFYLLTFLLFTVFTSNASTYEEAITMSLSEVLPLTATVTASSTSVCQNSTDVTITFTGSGGTVPYTFVYNINGGSPATITTTGTNSFVSLPVNTSIAGTFTYQLVSVTSAGVTETENNNVVVTVRPPITANFIFNTTAQCSGTSILFDSTVSGGSGTYNYSWDFGDGGTSSIADPSHVFTSLGCGNQTFTVKLTITSGGCTTVVNHPIIVKQKPNINFEDADIFFPFSNCQNNPSASNSNYTLVLNNVSPSLSCIVSYDINWGDNSTLIGATFPASHTYTQLGAFQLTVTAYGQNGCTSVKTYPVANQSNPAGGLGTLGATTGLCAPAIVPFTISNWELNSPGTTYLLNFGDGTSITLNHPLLSSTIYHTYTTSSCPEPTFTATLEVINLCDTTPYSAGNIQIRIRPEASFTGPLISCVGQNVCFTSNSILGSNGNNCTPLTVYTWNFGDPGGIGNVITGNGLTIPNGCHAYSVPGNYTVSLTLSNPCGPTTYTRQVCIESPLAPQFTLSQINGCSPLSVTTSNTTNLSNSCGTPTYLWNVNYAVGNCGSGTPASFYAAGSTSASANPSFQFVTPGTYSISLITTNSCGSFTSAIQTVSVKKPPTASIAAIATYCGSATITPTATISTCAPTGEMMTYAWTFPGGTPATSSSANPGPITYSSAGNYTVSLIVTNSCGASTSASQTFTVNVAPIITNTSLLQTICSGQQTSAVTLTASPSGATFAWTATGTAGVAGFITSGTSAVIPSQTITNTGLTPGTVTYMITPTLGTCAGSAATYIVTVNPTPSIVTHPADATVCQNAVMNPLNVAFIKGTGLPNYQWYSNTSNSNSGGTLIPSATSQTFIPPSTTVGTMYYYVVISFPTSGCANLISNTAAITINPPLSIATQPLLSQTICVGGSSSILSVSYNGGTGMATYQWYSNTTATNSGGTIINGQTSANYTPTGFSVPGTYHYYAVISMTGSGCGQAASNVATINVVADPTVILTPPSQIICAGVTPDAITATATGGNGAYSYQWYLNTTPSNVGGSIIATATNSTYTPPPSTPGIKYYYVIVKQLTSSGCEIISSTVSIQTILAATISTQPVSSTVCVGGSPTLLSVTYINGVGAPSYQWYSNTTNSTVGGTPISGATSTTYQPTASSIGTIYYYVIITLPSGGCSSLTSTIATVNVVEQAIITTQPTADQTICVGGSIAQLTVAYSGATGAASYQWYKNTTASNSGGTPISGATLATYTPPTFNTVGVFHFYATITISGNGCGAISSTIATVNVVADPTVTLSPVTQTLCAGASAAQITASASGGTGSFLYQWFSNTANNTTTGTSINGESNSTYTPPTTTLGTQYYYVIVTQAASGCSVISSTASVIVNPSPTINSQPVSSTVCVGGSPTLLSVAYINGVGAPSYQWYSNATNSTVGGTPISGATSINYQPTASTSGTTYYYVVITLPSGGCSSLTSNIATVNVVEPALITTQPTADQTICVGGSIAQLTVAYSGATGSPSYQWYKNTTASNSGGILITGATSDTYTPPTFNTVGVFHFYATITISGNGCGAISSTIATVNVVADPTVTLSPVTQTLCAGAIAAPITASASGGTGSYSYQWYSNTANNTTSGTFTGESNSTYTPSTTTLGTQYYYVIVTQAASGCSVISSTASIIVNPSPTISSQPTSSTVCVGGSPTLLSVTYINGVGTPSYQWYSNATNSTVGGTPISGATSNTYQPTASTSGTTYYYVVITLPSGGCSSLTSNIATVNVVEPAIITTQPTADQTICVGGSIVPLTVAYSGATGAPSYQWYKNTTASNSGGTSITGATSDTYTPPTFNIVGVFHFYATITISGNGCGSISSIIATVNVVADPTVTLSPVTQTLCAGAIAAPITASASGGTGSYSYQWYSNTANNTTSGTFTGESNSTYTPSTTTLGTQYYYVIVTQAASGCSVISSTASIIVNPSPTISSQPTSSTVCVGGSPTLLSVTYINGVGTPSYQWYSNATNSTVGGTPISGATSTTYQPTASSIGTIYYYVIITLPSGGCSSLTSNIATVNVVEPALITTQPTADQTICVGGSIAPLTVAYTGATGSPSYQWYKNTTASNSGGILITGATSDAYTPPTFNTVGVFHFYATITISGNGCGSISSNVATVNVVADPIVTLSPLTQTLCAGATAAPITASASGGTGSFLYQWFSNTANNTTSGTFTGESNSTYTPSTTTVGTQYYYVVVSTEISGCSTTSATSSVTVIASPTFTQQPAADTVCQGGTLSPLSVTYINGTGIPTYQWYSNSDNNTVSGTAISGATNPTYIPSAADIGTQFYYVIISLPSSAGCSSITSDTAEITITAGTTIVTQPIPSQSLCIGGSLPNNLEVEFSGGTGIPSYQWFNNTTAANSGGTAITGATASTYSPPTYLVAGTYYYYAVVSLSGNGCGAVASAVAQVIVFPDPIVTTQPITSQTLCQSATPATLSVAASGGVGTFSYQWYSSTTNSTVGGQLISGANLASFIPNTDVVGTMYYYVIISQSGAGCEVTSATSQVTINLAPSINLQPISETVCLDATLSTLSISYINGTGTPSYQWYSNTVDNTSTGIAISGANGSSFTPTSSTVGTLYYYAVVTLPSSGGCSAIISQTASITVNSLPTISLQPAATQSICIDGNIPAPLAVNYQGGNGVATYQWFSNAVNSNTGGTIIPGATGANYTPPIFTSSGNYYYYAVVTLSGNGCGNVASEAATVVVVNDPVVTAQPLPFQEICQNSVPSILTVNVSGGVGTIYNYQWYINTANNSSGGNPIAGATAQSYSPETNLIGTFYYYVMISQAPGAGCSTVSATSTIVINTAPVIQNQPSSSVICLGQTVVLGISYINGAGIPQYQWYSNTVNSTIGANPIFGATLSNYTPSTATAGTMYYYAVISLPGGCGDLISDIVFVTVNANPVIASTSQVICSGNSFTVNPDNTGGNVVPVGTTFTWSMPTITPPGSITGATAQGSQQPQISQTLINSTTSPSTVTYTVTPIWETCLGEDFTITVTVNPSISPNVTFANSTCYEASNGNIQTNITGGIPFPITPYQVSWTGPGGFTSSASSIFNLAPGTYHLTINDAGGCPFTASYLITEPDEIIISTDSENNITCFGDADGAISISVIGGTLPYQYTWTNNNLPFSTIEDIANLGPGNYTISVTDANGCGPATANFIILEPPLLTVTLGYQTNILCYSAATGAITVNVGGGTPIEISAGTFSYTFLWSGPNGFTSTEKDLTNLVAGTYNLNVTDQNGCSKNLTVILTQNTEIIITAITTPITCYGANNASISLTVSGGVGPYQAAWDNLATGLFQNNLGPGTYIITITDALGCQKPITVVIPDVPVFMVNPIVQQISCFGANNGSINLNLTGGIAPVTMIWTDGSTAGLIRNNLGPGSYTAIISDGTPCHITRTFVLVEPQPLALSATTINAFVCDNANSGSINLTVGGGTAPYTYSWTNGASTEDLLNITSGTYSVTVTDARGCTKTAQFTITRPSPIVIIMNVETIADCSIGSVKQIFTAQVSGGVAPFTNTWSSGTISGTNNQTMTTSQNTTVIFSTTDSLGCTASYTFDVDVPIISDADFSTTSIGYETYGLYSIIDPIQFTNGAQGNWTSISWNFGDGSFSTEENPTHSYVAEGPYVVTQTVTYPFGCVYKHIITLLVKKGYFLEVPSAFTPNGDSLNDTFRPISKGMHNVQLSVYDTWGALIYFEKGTILRGWDGTIKGRPAENGNYYCKVSAETFYRTTVNVSHPFVLIN